MITDWIAQELQTVHLNDQRLHRRLAEVRRSHHQQPHVRIPPPVVDTSKP